MNKARLVLRRSLDLARRNSRRVAKLSPPVARGGNLLYLWAWTHWKNIQDPKHAYRVQKSPHMEPWLKEFPSLNELTTPSRTLSPLDRRDSSLAHHFGNPLGTAEIRDFVDTFIRSSHTFSSRLNIMRNRVTSGDLVLNIRRGDYYSNEQFLPLFGIDNVQHTKEALALLGIDPESRPRAFIVSDDVEWCQRHLGTLLELRRPLPPEEKSMFNDLAALAVARTLIIPNSTFSYWGQFIGQALFGEQKTVAPGAHEYNPDTGQLIDSLFNPAWLRTGAFPGIYSDNPPSQAAKLG